jgi:hypothetical protein
MAVPASGSNLSICRLILVPSLITLAVTVLRLVGELQHWSPRFFNPSAGGGGAIVGIVWLPIIFGPYFGLKLWGAGQGPKGTGKAIGYVCLGLVVFVLAGFVGFAPQIRIPGKELWGFLLMIVAAGLVFPGWPALFKTLVAYAYAARIPVAIIMFFAIRGNWGTHYDAPPPGYAEPASFWAKYFQIGLLPQLIFWVAFTIILGALLGAVVAGIVHRRKAGREAN